MRGTVAKKWTAILAVVVLNGSMAGCSRAEDRAWNETINSIKWVDYSPSTGNPDQQVEPSVDSVRADLSSLRQAHFSGLITYSSKGRLGRELISLAKDAGFRGIILGVWDPTDKDELNAAKTAAGSELVVGVCVGNEGLMDKRYSLEALQSAITEIRKATGKPVTTTEIIQQYDGKLISLVDWAFPNAHPYFASVAEPRQAVAWTEDQFRKLKGSTSRAVMLKEVGLPTAGDPNRPLSEQAQCEYYVSLAKTRVRFAYFEAFDQTWKLKPPVEPHWGIFRSDRSAKELGHALMTNAGCGAAPGKPEPVAQSQPVAGESFYVYKDNGAPVNHFSPTGRMGDVGDITLVDDWEGNPQSGKTAIKVEYTAKGEKPTCEWNGPCGWAGVTWQEPPGNSGKKEDFKDKGYDLSHFKKLKFWARADHAAVIDFKVGGIVGQYGDSLFPARGFTAHLTEAWMEYTIDLSGANLKYVIGGFTWAASKERNPKGATFYLDEIRFVSE
jgi:exo-beta-1,3-glucanase (GH17 family)